MLAEKLDIFIDTNDLARLLMRYQRGERPKREKGMPMPKYVSHGIMQQCTENAIRCLDLVYLANSDITQRRQRYKDYLLSLQGIKTRVSLMHDLHYLGDRQASNLQALIAKCGRQATALRNASQSREICAMQ